MEWMRLVLSASLSGVGVVVATSLAGRIQGRWSGIVAALPVTPTSGILVLGSIVDADAALRALATVAAALLAIMGVVSVGALRSRAGILLGLAAIAPVAFALDQLAVPIVALIAVVALATARATVRIRAAQMRSACRMAWPLRFGIGAAAVLVVAAAEALLPGAGVLLAMMPVLFVTTLVVVLFEHGPLTVHGMLPGGVAGSAGMTAFVTAYALTWQMGLPSVAGLAVAWAAFAATALVWQATAIRAPLAGPIRS